MAAPVLSAKFALGFRPITPKEGDGPNVSIAEENRFGRTSVGRMPRVVCDQLSCSVCMSDDHGPTAGIPICSRPTGPNANSLCALERAAGFQVELDQVGE